MATGDKLQKLISTKAAIKDAINQKGGTITDQDTFSSYPNYILALNVNDETTSEGDSLYFKDIGYNFFPIDIQNQIAYSKDYQTEFNQRNDNILNKDENLVYLPKLEINENIDTIDFNNSQCYNFTDLLPNLKVFSDTDFKGRSYSETWAFNKHQNIVQAFLKNIVFTSYTIFNECPNLEFASLEGVKLYYGEIFDSCPKLKKIVLNNIDMSSVTSTRRMFYNCECIESIEGISNLDVSNVTNMEEMFNSTGGLKELNLTNWNVQSVTSMNDFIHLYNSDQYTDINLSGWNLKSYEGGDTIIDGYFNSLNLSNWNLPKVKTEIPTIINRGGDVNLSNWKLPVLTKIEKKFINCSGKINLSGWKLPQVTKITGEYSGGNYSLFSNTNPEEIDLSNWECPNVTYCLLLSNYNTRLKILNLANWDFSRIQASTSVFLTKDTMKDNNNNFQIIGPISGINVQTFWVSDLPANITVDSIMVIINGLEMIEDGTTHTLKMFSTQKSKLTTDQIAVATSKGWTVA